MLSFRFLIKCLSDSTDPFKHVDERRSNSFRAVLDSPVGRKRLLEEFLETQLRIESPSSFYRIITKAAWDKRNQNDGDIYVAIQDSLQELAGSPIHQLTTTWNGISQLRDQKAEIVRQIISIVGHLGKMGAVHDYVSIGDHGKCVLQLSKKLPLHSCVVVHDKESDDIPAVLERGSVDAVGRFQVINYETLRLDLESCSADLITLNQVSNPTNIVVFSLRNSTAASHLI